MTNEELLKDRYKVISDSLGRETWEDIGYIITMPDSRYKYSGDIICGRELFDSYPDIYKRLNWSDERNVEDMPEYVRILFSGRIAKVIKWNKIEHGWGWVCSEVFGDHLDDEVYPATKEEFENQNK